MVDERGCEGEVTAYTGVDVLDGVVHEGEGAEALGEEPGLDRGRDGLRRDYVVWNRRGRHGR